MNLEDVINGAEIISLVGKRNLVVENYVKVVEYSEELIGINDKLCNIMQNLEVQ